MNRGINLFFKTFALALIVLSVITLWDGRDLIDGEFYGQESAMQQSAVALYALAWYLVPAVWLAVAACLAWLVSESKG